MLYQSTPSLSGLGLVCLVVFNVTFNNISATFVVYCGGQFYWWRKPEYLEKTIDLSQVTDKLHSEDSNSQH
jgi:hypothetical protein